MIVLKYMLFKILRLTYLLIFKMIFTSLKKCTLFIASLVPCLNHNLVLIPFGAATVTVHDWLNINGFTYGPETNGKQNFMLTAVILSSPSSPTVQWGRLLCSWHWLLTLDQRHLTLCIKQQQRKGTITFLSQDKRNEWHLTFQLLILPQI